MPPFLSVMGTERSESRAVRVGGKVAKFGQIIYVDLGKVAAPGVVTGAAEETSGTLAQNTNYNYVVTATDAFGGETTSSPEVTVKTNNVGATNRIKLSWTAVPGATAYNVYRAKNESGKEVLVAEGVEATTYTDLNATAKTATPPATNNTYVRTGKGAFSASSELKNHLAVGGLIHVGGITQSNLDWVAVSEAGFALTFASEEAKVAEAKEVRQRSTGIYRSAGPAAAAFTGIKSTTGNEKFVAIVYNPSTNKIEAVTGADEVEGSGVVTNVVAKVPAGSELLYVVNTKNTTKTVTNATTQLSNPPVIARV